MPKHLAIFNQCFKRSGVTQDHRRSGMIANRKFKDVPAGTPQQRLESPPVSIYTLECATLECG
jgi:hypothetical protein